IDRGIKTEDFTQGLALLNKNPRPIEILTPEEIEKIINTEVPYGRFRKFTSEEVTETQNQLYRAFTRFLAYTGARFSEAANLTLQYVDLASGKVTFVDTKNKTNRRVWVTEPVISEMRECMAGKNQHDLVFTNFVGSPVIPQNYGLHLRRVSSLAGIKKRVHPHIFRHSFATQLLIAGVDVTMVASILGHRDIQTTYQNYVHLADETLKKSIYRHPLVRKNIDPKEIIRIIRDAIASLRIENDPRFSYTLSEGSNCLQFDLKIK
ncbi:MAG: tyrosine-type recombinase/integrase, partial [Patescibacteria group bacterium]